MRTKRNKKILALVLILTLVFSFNAYALTSTMTAQNNGIVSVWNLELTSTYMGSGMYIFTSTERQVKSRKFDNVNMHLEVFCVGTDIIKNFSSERVYILTGTISADPSKQAVGSAYSKYIVDDELYGHAEDKIYYN